MLHAVNQGKSNIYKRYLGHRDGTEKRVYEEDEITALLLGPLALLPEKESAAFWHHLLRDLEAPDYTDQLPGKSKMQFWPSMAAEPKRRIEPDLLVELFWSGGQKIKLIVELKWRASLSGEDQLHRQWQHCFSATERQTGYHLFIAQETSEALKAKSNEQGDVWKGRLLDASWYQLIRFFEQLPTSLQPWAEQVCGALNKLGIRRFNGFNKLTPTQVIEWSDNQPLFWQEFSDPALVKY